MPEKPIMSQLEKMGSRPELSSGSMHPQTKSSPVDVLSNRCEDWKQIVNTIPDLIFVMDRDYHIVWANHAARDKLALPMKDIVGKNCYQLVHGLNTPPLNCPYEKLVSGTPTSHTA